MLYEYRVFRKILERSRVSFSGILSLEFHGRRKFVYELLLYFLKKIVLGTVFYGYRGEGDFLIISENFCMTPSPIFP